MANFCLPRKFRPRGTPFFFFFRSPPPGGGFWPKKKKQKTARDGGPPPLNVFAPFYGGFLTQKVVFVGPAPTQNDSVERDDGSISTGSIGAAVVW